MNQKRKRFDTLLETNKIDCNQIDISDGRTPLIDAVIVGNLYFCKKLIEIGADINVKDNGGMTALKRAELENQNDIAKLLMENGATK